MTTRTPYTLAIVGSRELTEPQVLMVELIVEGIIQTFHRKIDNFYLPHFRVISGGADGVDSITREITAALGLSACTDFEEYLPTIHRWEGEGGFKWRNLRMIEAADALVCIQSQQSKTHGSGWTYEEAVRQGMKPGVDAFRYWV
jgi:hypothetical protein